MLRASSPYRNRVRTGLNGNNNNASFRVSPTAHTPYVTRLHLLQADAGLPSDSCDRVPNDTVHVCRSGVVHEPPLVLHSAHLEGNKEIASSRPLGEDIFMVRRFSTGADLVSLQSLATVNYFFVCLVVTLLPEAVRRDSCPLEAYRTTHPPSWLFKDGGSR